jgi:hypothetical protein
MVPFDPLMFPDLCTLVPAAPSGSDDSAGRTDVGGTPVPDVPCRYREASDGQVADAQAVGVRINALVYLAADPGPLPSGSVIRITSRAGDTPPKPLNLSVQRLVRQGIPPLVLWRAEGLGKT